MKCFFLPYIYVTLWLIYFLLFDINYIIQIIPFTKQIIGDVRMRRFFIGVFVIGTGILSACALQTENKADVALKHADLTPFEESLKDLIRESTSVFELEIQNDEAEVIEIFIDSYEHGEKQEEIMQFCSHLIFK